MPFGAPYASPKPGKFGNARDGAITPRKRVTPPRTVPHNLSTSINEKADTAEQALTDVVYDPTSNKMVFTRQPVSGGGGTSLLLGTIIGGNTTHMGVAAGTVEPGTFSFPVPLSLDGVNVDPGILPTVADWDAIKLPDDYVIGDPVPVLPNGLCYIKLERPYSFGGSSWLGNFPPHVTIQTTVSPKLVDVTHEVSATNGILTLYFDRNVSAFGVASAIHVIDKTVTKILSGISQSIDGNIVTLYLDDSLDLDHSYVLSFSQVQYQSVGGGQQFFADAVQEFPVRFMSDRFVVVYGINRRAYQTFFAGDLVFLSDESFTLTDDLGAITHSLVDVISNASNVRSPHSHLNPRFDQSGPAGPALIQP